MANGQLTLTGLAQAASDLRAGAYTGLFYRNNPARYLLLDVAKAEATLSSLGITNSDQINSWASINGDADITICIDVELKQIKLYTPASVASAGSTSKQVALPQTQKFQEEIVAQLAALKKEAAEAKKEAAEAKKETAAAKKEAAAAKKETAAAKKETEEQKKRADNTQNQLVKAKELQISMRPDGGRIVSTTLNILVSVGALGLAIGAKHSPKLAVFITTHIPKIIAKNSVSTIPGVGLVAGVCTAAIRLIIAGVRTACLQITTEERKLLNRNDEDLNKDELSKKEVIQAKCENLKSKREKLWLKDGTLAGIECLAGAVSCIPVFGPVLSTIIDIGVALIDFWISLSDGIASGVRSFNISKWVRNLKKNFKVKDLTDLREKKVETYEDAREVYDIIFDKIKDSSPLEFIDGDSRTTWEHIKWNVIEKKDFKKLHMSIMKVFHPDRHNRLVSSLSNLTGDITLELMTIISQKVNESKSIIEGALSKRWAGNNLSSTVPMPEVAGSVQSSAKVVPEEAVGSPVSLGID